MAAEKVDNCDQQFDSLREEMRKTNELIENKLQKIETMLEKMQAGGIPTAAVKPHYSHGRLSTGSFPRIEH